MTFKNLSAALMLGTALIVTGCGNKSSNNETTKDAKIEDSMTKRKARASQAISYTDAGKTDEDHLWLEEVEGENALEKVKSWNAVSNDRLTGSRYQDMKAELLGIYNSPEKIPYVSYRRGEAHNFWQDENHVKGIWRKTTLESYASGNPEWETVLDIDALAEKEGKNWVYKGNSCLAPTYTRCIVNLSDGGKDAVVRREFNVKSGKFVKKGFVTPESKGSSTWLDKDHMIIGVDFGEGTMTESGYPRQVRLWKRGTPLKDAKLLYEGDSKFVGSWGSTMDRADGGKEIMFQNSLTFYETDYYWLPQSGDKTNIPQRLPLPKKSGIGAHFKGQTLLSLQEDWRGHKAGTLLSFSFEEFMETGKIETLSVVFAPKDRQTLNNYGVTKNAVLMSISENVAASAYAFRFKDGAWSKKKLDFPENGTISIGSTNDKETVAFINTESFLEPDTLWSINTKGMSIAKVRSLPDWFDSSSMTAEQYEVASTDGTKIPYFVVMSKDLEMNGKNPTLLYGYGGFQISMNPSYSGTNGKAWLERGGVYVLSNIRGGGEFGPNWHQAGLKTKRQIIYDDFIAIAEDLIERKITSPRHLGIHGGSNGGLLMGVMMTQRPDLFNAVAVGVPLLDMNRYDKLLAGASWVGEYGDPDDDGAEGAFIRNLSPYHNIVAGAEYPEALIYTSTKDDRVHPAHARKFAQRLEDYGIPFLYYENIDGGHSAAANLKESAHKNALIYAYFHQALK